MLKFPKIGYFWKSQSLVISKPSFVIRFDDFMAILAKKQDFLSVRCRPAVRGQSGRNYKFGLKQGNIGFLASLDQKFNKIDQKESQNFLVC